MASAKKKAAAKPATDTKPDPRAAIAYHAAECLKALELAAFAENEPLYADGAGLAAGLRKLAAYSAEQVFAWVPKLAVAS